MVYTAGMVGAGEAAGGVVETGRRRRRGFRWGFGLGFAGFRRGFG